MALNNLFTDGEPQPRPRSFLSMQAFEGLKNTVAILWSDTNPVITDREDPTIIPPCRRDVNLWPQAVAILDCIPNQILKQFQQLRGMHANSWQTVMSYCGVSRENGHSQISEG